MAWSTTAIDEFWRALADYHDVTFHQRATTVLAHDRMPGAAWFPGATLNYAEQALRHRGDHPAVVAVSEGGTPFRDQPRRAPGPGRLPGRVAA